MVDTRRGYHLTFYAHSSGHPAASRPRLPPSPLKRCLARADSREYNTGRPVPHDTPIDNGHPQPTKPDDTDLAECHRNVEPITDKAYANALPEPGSQEKFNEEVMIYYHAVEPSLASQFLNLDDQIAEAGAQPLPTSSSNLSGIGTGSVLEREAEPASFHLVDMKKLETVTDFDGGDKTVPWPWGDYEYRPSTPWGYVDPEEYAAEYHLSEIEKVLRDELREIMAQEAILAGEQEVKQKEKREGKRTEKGKYLPGTVAFNNQVVRGRTIYNL